MQWAERNDLPHGLTIMAQEAPGGCGGLEHSLANCHGEMLPVIILTTAAVAATTAVGSVIVSLLFPRLMDAVAGVGRALAAAEPVVEAAQAVDGTAARYPDLAAPPQQVQVPPGAPSDPRVFASNAEGAAYGEQTWAVAHEQLSPEQRSAVWGYTLEARAPGQPPTYKENNAALRGLAPMTPDIQFSAGQPEDPVLGSVPADAEQEATSLNVVKQLAER